MVRAKVAMYDTRRLILSHTLLGVLPATAKNYGVIFICPAASRYKLVAAHEVHSTVGGALATVIVEKCTGVQAPGAGTEILDGDFDLTATINAVQYATIATISDALRTLASGDRLAVKEGGTIAGAKDVLVVVELEELVPLRAKEAPYEKERIIISTALPGAHAQTAAEYTHFFIASVPCRLVAARLNFTTATGGAGTLQIEKLIGTTAPAAGVHMLDGTGFDLNGTAETVQDATLSTTPASLVLARGDRLALDDDGALGALVGVCVTVELEAIQ